MLCFGDCYVIVAGLFAGSASERLAINVMFVVLSCHSIEVQGSLPRFEILTFCGHVLRHRDILLARAIVVLLKGRQFRHLVDTSHRELQSKWLYKEITTREVLSGFYGTLVVLRYEYHSPSLR